MKILDINIESTGFVGTTSKVSVTFTSPPKTVYLYVFNSNDTMVVDDQLMEKITERNYVYYYENPITENYGVYKVIIEAHDTNDRVLMYEKTIKLYDTQLSV